MINLHQYRILYDILFCSICQAKRTLSKNNCNYIMQQKVFIIFYNYNIKVIILLLICNFGKVCYNDCNMCFYKNMATSKRKNMDNVIITGASGGIGKELVNQYSKVGYRVFALDINAPTTQLDNVVYCNVDLRDCHAIEECFINIYERYGAIHILINNGAISHFCQDITNITLEQANSVFDTNLRGALWCAKNFVSCNKGAQYGRIVNISSTRHIMNEPNWELYGATKGGISSLTTALCVSLANSGITVNTVSPGWIQCTNYDRLTDQDHTQHPSGRVGKPIDIARVCMFLTDKASDFINGTDIVVDGGMTKKMIYV